MLGRLGHVLDDQHRRRVGVVVSDANHAHGFVTEVNRVPGAQFGTALLSSLGSAGVPSALSSLNRNPAIRFSLPLSAGAERHGEHTTRVVRKNRLHGGIWLGGRAGVVRLRDRNPAFSSPTTADAAPARTVWRLFLCGIGNSLTTRAYLTEQGSAEH